MNSEENYYSHIGAVVIICIVTLCATALGVCWINHKTTVTVELIKRPYQRDEVVSIASSIAPTEKKRR